MYFSPKRLSTGVLHHANILHSNEKCNGNLGIFRGHPLSLMDFSTEPVANLYSGWTFAHWVTKSSFIPIYVDSLGFGLTLAREFLGLPIGPGLFHGFSRNSDCIQPLILVQLGTFGAPHMVPPWRESLLLTPQRTWL